MLLHPPNGASRVSTKEMTKYFLGISPVLRFRQYRVELDEEMSCAY